MRTMRAIAEGGHSKRREEMEGSFVTDVSRCRTQCATLRWLAVAAAAAAVRQCSRFLFFF